MGFRQQYNINETLEKLSGPTPEEIIVKNQKAITALDLFHKSSRAKFKFSIDGTLHKTEIAWDSNFQKNASRDKRQLAENGAISFAWFLMSVLLDYSHLEQTEQKDGTDYFFMKEIPPEDDLNFLKNSHYVEISGLLEEKGSNTLKKRLKDKHGQISRGRKADQPSSVIVSLIKFPNVIKDLHHET
ncbi:MAG: hypothetical protein Q8J88_01210 [Bacteroidales bacterium]|nr:hypothetical protein [Bacteroidales bacterium]